MSNKEDDKMSVNPEVVMNERKRKALEEGRKKLQDPEKVKAFLLAAGSVKTEYVIDSQQICREVRGKA